MYETNATCRICGTDNRHVLVRFHVIPPKFGGEKSDNNCVILCANCRRTVRAIYSDDVFEQMSDIQYLDVDEPDDALETKPSPEPADDTDDSEQLVLDIIVKLQEQYDGEPGAPHELVIEQATDDGLLEREAEQTVRSLRDQGKIYSPDQESLRRV